MQMLSAAISWNAFQLIISHLVLIIHSSLSGDDSGIVSDSLILILLYVGTNFADKQWSLSWCGSLVDLGHGGFFF
jgi:hypothetical protein